MAIPATQIRRGMVIVFEGEPCRVVEFRHHTPGNLRAMIQTKLRSLRSGSSFEHRFRSADTIERAMLEQHEMEYLYSDGSHHHFMNTENLVGLLLLLSIARAWFGRHPTAHTAPASLPKDLRKR